ncbi:MAG: serine/threonine-protein phosphatase [Opitutaceae bacterium]|nr:serine/threonine-protein phosphatase [Opitutaceae bacterium]
MTPPPATVKQDPLFRPTQSLPIVRWSGITDRGRVRENNEDAFLALAIDAHEVRYLGKTGEAFLAANDFVFAVSDGMGGAKSGEIASKLAVDRITQLLPPIVRRSQTSQPEARIEVLGKLFASIHQDLTFLGRSYEECAGMGATLSLCWIAHDQVYFAHVGDSRIYHFPAPGGSRQLTDDHNHVGWLRRKGRINEREARSHPMRHSLHQAMGAGIRNIDPQVGIASYAIGDRFLLCSDGVIDGLWDRNLDDLIREAPASPAKSTAQRIVEEAIEKSGRDNATALVVEFLPAEPPVS